MEKIWKQTWNYPGKISRFPYGHEDAIAIGNLYYFIYFKKNVDKNNIELKYIDD